ncbi:Uncharacterised protein [Mycobacteroides abscessus subsp. abscessus]|nr:Uncharacterised protein [Mycobacteroides abscessus subsp. abscessus]
MAPSTVMSHARPRRVAGGETEPAGVRSIAGSSAVVLPGALVTSVLSARTWQNLPFPNKCELHLTQSVKSPLPSRRRHRPHYRRHQRRRTISPGRPLRSAVATDNTPKSRSVNIEAQRACPVTTFLSPPRLCS